MPLEEPVLLCIGLVRPYKGFLDAVKALPGIKAGRPSVRLVIAGEAYDSELDDHLKEAADPAILRDARYIPDAEVGRFCSAADVMLLPYRSGTQSGALAAAAHFDLPVVVTEVEGLAGPVRRFGMGCVVPAAAPDALAAGVLRLLEGDALEEARQGCRRMRREATWSAFADTLDELIEGR